MEALLLLIVGSMLKEKGRLTIDAYTTCHSQARSDLLDFQGVSKRMEWEILLVII